MPNIDMNSRLLQKIKQYGSKELLEDPEFKYILQDSSLLYSLLNQRSFQFFEVLPKWIFKDFSMSLLLMNYGKPPVSLISDEILSSPGFLQLVFDNHFSHIQYIPTQFLTTELLTWYCVSFGKEHTCLKYFPKTLLNKELCKILVGKNALHFKELPEHFRNDIEIYSEINKKYYKELFEYAGLNIRSNPFLATQALEENAALYNYLSDNLKNADFFLRRLSHIPDLLAHVSDKIKDNEHCVWESVKVNAASLYYASERLLNMPSFASQVCKNMTADDIQHSFEAWGMPVLDNKEFVIEILPKLCQAECLSHVSEKIRGDKEVMRKAINIDPYSFSFVTLNLTDDISFLIDCFHDLTNKNKKGEVLFQYLKSSSFEKPFYLLGLFENFHDIFVQNIYPHISKFNTPLILDLNESFESNNLYNFMEKIKLHSILEEELNNKTQLKNTIKL